MGLLFEVSVIFIEWVSRKVEPHQITLPEKLIFFGNLSGRGLNDRLWNRTGVTHHPEEVSLAGSLIFLNFSTISLNIFEVK